MSRYIALLRAVNVGGTGKLPMAELRNLCSDAGFSGVKTYIASGNVVFTSNWLAAEVKSGLELRLRACCARDVAVFVRTEDEMQAVQRGNPFPDAAPNRTAVLFLDSTPRPDSLHEVVGQTNEDLRLGAREIYIHYPDGLGRSKLRVPSADSGTARNMNTVAKLVSLAADL